MPDLPDELRDRAANAAFDAWSRDRVFTWFAVADAVAGVLAEHQTEAALRVGEQRVAHRRELAEVKSERDRYKEAWRSEVNRLLDDMDRKLSKQRKRRKGAEARVAELEELNRRGEVDVERDQLSLMLRRMARRVGERRDESHHYATRLMEAYECQNDLCAKLSKQRKRRKAAEAKVAVLEAMIRSYRDCLLLTRRQLDDTRKELPDE